MIKKIFIILVLLTPVMALICTAQDCKDFHKTPDCYVYIPLDREFKIYNQAKSLSVPANKPVVYKIILFGGKDYIVGVCSQAEFYRKIQLRIYDGINKKLLYDNKDHDYIESFGFTVTKTQPLEMEVIVLADDKSKNTDVCVGFQILYSDPVKK